MKKICVITAIFVTLIFVFKTYADENIIRLICIYSHTLDADGKSSPTSGKDLVTVNCLSNGKAIIKQQGLGAEFIGKITDEDITGETEYEISGKTIQQIIMINRFTGEFKLTFQMIGKKGGLIHFGTCEPVEKRKF